MQPQILVRGKGSRTHRTLITLPLSMDASQVHLQTQRRLERACTDAANKVAPIKVSGLVPLTMLLLEELASTHGAGVPLGGIALVAFLVLVMLPGVSCLKVAKLALEPRIQIWMKLPTMGQQVLGCAEDCATDLADLLLLHVVLLHVRQQGDLVGHLVRADITNEGVAFFQLAKVARLEMPLEIVFVDHFPATGTHDFK